MGLWGEAFLDGGFLPDYRAQIRLTVSATVTQALAGLQDVGTVTVLRGAKVVTAAGAVAATAAGATSTVPITSRTSSRSTASPRS